ncbi:ABC transporter ATP-binding protein [Paraneptunicella aestuarii]|uniref:ABC transporter ATP-binding protein n=1 Tax=Paraneptunicella aestuarii TaxID=2831148 RepID=UPI001E3BA6CC|nr:ABC transporter ATP-binding protein [Paraneptunicella aestuarii]UAA39795.1 ABC transporter ATP-binding protein [Paraneptunicella aestuarii]
MEYIIEVDGLAKSFQGMTAVNHISFKVKKGQCFGLLGPNGAGKTTTIEMLEGILPKDAGTIKYHGEEMTREALHKIGIQFQHTALQDFLTTRDTLKLFAAFYNNPVPEAELIKLCDLQEFIDRDHRKLSGGQRQRLLLALALVNDPDVLFLDEPTTGMDPHARRKFWDLINGIKHQGKTIILTTHYMDEAEYLCDEIVIMDKGAIIESGHPNSLLAKHFTGALIRLDPQELPESIHTRYQVTSTEGFCEFATDNVQRAIQELTSENISLEGMHIKSANLDDLFLKLTGQQLEEV